MYDTQATLPKYCDAHLIVRKKMHELLYVCAKDDRAFRIVTHSAAEHFYYVILPQNSVSEKSAYV